MTGWTTALAPAKVNLNLEVLGRRADGFHELVTTMVALELADRVSVRPRDDGEITLAVEGPQASPDVPRDERNLVWRAAREMLALLDAKVGVDLRIEKHVPSRAGLGGGSSDAAACVAAVSHSLGAESRKRQCELLLAELGSDCVFFSSADSTGAAVCEGRGELVRPVSAPAPPWNVAILVPSVDCPTGGVFGALEFPLSAPGDGHSLDFSLLQRCALETRPWLKNDLEEAAIRVHPELADWRSLLDETRAAHFRMSGSGSAFFGIHDDEQEALETIREVERVASARGLTWRVSTVTRTSSRAAHVVTAD